MPDMTSVTWRSPERSIQKIKRIIEVSRKPKSKLLCVKLSFQQRLEMKISAGVINLATAFSGRMTVIILIFPLNVKYFENPLKTC